MMHWNTKHKSTTKYAISSTPCLFSADENNKVPNDITFLLLEDVDRCVIEHKLGVGGFKDCYAENIKE